MNDAEHRPKVEPQFEWARLRIQPADGPMRAYEARYPVLFFSRLIPRAHDFIVELAESVPPSRRPFLLRWATAIRF